MADQNKKIMKKRTANQCFSSIYKFLFIAFVFFYSNISAQMQLCSATLTVEDGRDSKRAGESGTFYDLTLTNLSAGVTTYEITIANFKENTFAKQGIPNVALDGKLHDMKKNALTVSDLSEKKASYNITLKQGSSFHFYARLKVPYGTSIGSKNNTIITVTSKKCAEFKVSKMLSTLIIDGE